MRAAALLVLSGLMSQAAAYHATRATVDGFDVVRLEDPSHHIEASIVPKIGNIAYELKVSGKNMLYFPFASLKEFQAKPALCGVPFLAPWANRLDQPAFSANGKRYALNTGLGNLRFDGNHLPIHGLLAFSPLWEVVEIKSNGRAAWVVSRLEFWKHPDLMAQFPFAHTIEMTYRLADGTFEVETSLKNLSTDPMPVSIGFHPYFTLHDAPRDTWKAHLAAREHVVLSKQLTPTGETKPMELANPFSLAGAQLDDVFTALERGPDGRAEFRVEGKEEKLSVFYGPKYTVAVAYAPPGKTFICFEPMAALTNGMNLPGYKGLQHIAPNAEWRESFWIRASN